MKVRTARVMYLSVLAERILSLPNVRLGGGGWRHGAM
jgi:hypothetical protein